MYKIFIFTLCSTISFGCLAMEPENPKKSMSLRDICKIEVKDLKLVNVLPGEQLPQQQVVHDFFKKLPQVVDCQTDQLAVDVKQLRSLLKTAVKALPRADSCGQTTASQERAREVLKKTIEPTSGSVTTITLTNGTVEVHTTSPVLSRSLPVNDAAQTPSVHVTQINELGPIKEISRLRNLLSGKSRLATIAACAGSVFIAGMIVGWFYTTKAHKEYDILQQSSHI